MRSRALGPTRSAATCDQPPGARQVDDHLPGLIAIFSWISNSLYAARTKALARLERLTYSSLTCRCIQR